MPCVHVSARVAAIHQPTHSQSHGCVSLRCSAIPSMSRSYVWLAGKDMVMKLPTTERVLALLRTGTPDERVAFVKQLPPNELLESGIDLVSSTNPGMVVV